MTRNLGLIALTTCAICLVGWLSTAPSQPPPAARRTVFSSLKVGQPIVLKDRGGLFEIGTVDDTGPLGHNVVEVGADYLAVRDGAGGTETRIPVSAVRAVVTVSPKAK